MIRTLLVDDEPLAREGLRVRLAPARDIEIVGEAGDGPEAVEQLLTLRPDLVFLDVQIPGIDGFAVLERVAGQHLPLVVFVTAFDEFAVRAFEVNALDYLLKPISEARLAESLARVRRELDAERPDGARERVVRLLDSVNARSAPGTVAGSAASGAAGTPRGNTAGNAVDNASGSAPGTRRAMSPGSSPVDPSGTTIRNRFLVREGDRYVVVKAAEVTWIGAAGNYVELHLGIRSVLLRMTLSELERQLDPHRFVRIHRSTIVALDEVREIVPEWHGDSEVVLRGGQVLRMSRKYRGRMLPSGGAER